MRKLLLTLSLLLSVVFSVVYPDEIPDDGRSKENKNFEAQSESGWLKFLIENNIGVIRNSFRTTWTGQGNRHFDLDTTVETRIYDLDKPKNQFEIERDKNEQLLFPIEFRITTNIGEAESTISMRDLRIGLMRALFHNAGVSLQGFSYLMKQADFNLGTFHGCEIISLTLNEFADLKKGGNGTISLVIRATGSWGYGSLTDGVQKDFTNEKASLSGSSSRVRFVEGTNVTSSGSIGIRFNNTVLVEFFGGVDLFLDGDTKCKGCTVAQNHYGSGIRYFPTKWVNIGVRGRVDQHNVENSISFEDLKNPIIYSKSVDSSSGLLTLELRW